MTDAPVLIVGAGPTGMTAALDLAHYGIPSILFDEDHELSEGSRAIAYSAATLAVWEKLGAGRAMLAKGVVWSARHTYYQERKLYTQSFPQVRDGFLPGFFNLQQYYVERFLLDEIESSSLIQVCWDHRVTGLRQEKGGVVLAVSRPGGDAEFSGEFVLACDGARSTVRKLLDLPFPGATHRDHFLIADIRVDLQAPPEPRFYFDHPSNPGQTVLIHPQPDGVWRIDWQVGPEVDIQVERDPKRLERRIRPLIGDLPYEIEWLSDYRFHQRLLPQFRHGQVFFLGDAAHLVAPFGARGLNSAVADVENLAWKLALVLKHAAPDSLLDSYQTERWQAQQHNQVVTDRTMHFMSPPGPVQRALRNWILRLSPYSTAARRRVDSGKMAEPFTYTGSPLLVSDDSSAAAWKGAPVPGSQAKDAPCTLIRAGIAEPIFLRKLLGSGFVGLYFAARLDDGLPFLACTCPQLPGLPLQVYPVLTRRPVGPAPTTFVVDENGTPGKRFAAAPGAFFLLRPDGHIAARRKLARPEELPELICKACGIG
jgi:3-(3-hydroxy-phenyl)propionate hydroxylase